MASLPQVKRAVLAALCLVGSRAAFAQPSVESCATASEEAQRKQSKGALLEARQLALTCANPACPAEIVTFCAGIAEDVGKSMPTIVVAAIDAESRDVAGVTLVIDGKEPGAPLDGRPIEIDPGDHKLRLVPASGSLSPVDLDVSVRAGEKNRRVEARFGGGAAVEPKKERESSALVVPTAIAFSIGGAALIAGAVTGALALSEDASIGEECPTPASCPASLRDRIDANERLGIGSTVSFVIGGVGVGVGVALVIALVSESTSKPVEATANGFLLRF